MAFYRFGRLSDRECIRVADRLGLGQQFDKYTVFLRLANGGRFGILEKHSLPLKHIDAKIQIDVLYGDTKNYRSNIFFWNSKYGDQIPENAIIIGDTKNAGFLVYIYSGVEKGIYYWDDSYALECSDQNSNAYFIADDIERLLFDANASFKKIFNHKTTRLPDKIIGENNMLYRVPGSKKLQKVNAIACKLNTHRCNNFCIKPEFTREYELECLVRDAIKWVEKETEYVFSDALKEYIFDDSLKSIKSTHFSVLGQVGGVKGLTALRFDDYDFDNDGWRINFAGYDVEHAIEDGDTQRAEALKELHKDYIVFARVSDDCCVFGRTSNDYFAIKKSTDEIFVYNRDDLRMEKVADDFESFIVRFYNEDERLKQQSEIKNTFKDLDELSEEEIICFMGKLDNLFYMGMPTPEDVEEAQNELGVRFAKDYNACVTVGGVICGGGIELTGVTEFDRLNVVKATQRARRINKLIPNNMYVVEDVGIDGMVVLQDESGTIYTAQPYLAPKKLFNSLIEYIENVGRFTTLDFASKKYSYKLCDEFGQDLKQRMENGLIPILPSGKIIHLHHMGLSMNASIDSAPMAEFDSEYYSSPKVIETLFNGFDGEHNYDRIKCIYQRQEYWKLRVGVKVNNNE